MYRELGAADDTCLNVLHGHSLNEQRDTENTSAWTDNCPTQIQTR